MTKEKKIGITYYLNRRLKPVGDAKFPVYMRITFNRKQAEIKCDPDLYWNEHELVRFLEHRETGSCVGTEKLLVGNEVVLNDIVREKYEREKDQFSLRGLSVEFNYNLSNVFETVHSAVVEAMKIEFGNILSPAQYSMINIVNVADGYHLTKALVPDLKKKISERLKVMLQTFSTLSMFFILHSNFELFGKGKTVYAWEKKGRKIEFWNFLDSEEWIGIDKKLGHNDPFGRLHNEFSKKIDKKAIFQTIENQLIAKKNKE